MPENPTHLRWPLATVTLPGGAVTYAAVPQDSDEEIRRGLALACELRPGQLEWDEELGIPDPLGSTDPDAVAAVIGAALQAIEPRAEITVDLDDTPDGRQIRPRILTS